MKKELKQVHVYSDEEKTEIFSRLNRISGQIGGIKRMVSDGKTYDKVVTQLAAIEKAVKSLSNYILATNLRTSAIMASKSGSAHEIDELIETFKRFNK